MRVARMLYPVEVLGPGKRAGIWVNGCKRGCKCCISAELWREDVKYNISVKQLIQAINKINNSYEIDGFTITGGEPFEQSAELKELIGELININDDIMIYTGFTLGELRKKDDKNISAVLAEIAVLIDGEYIEELNDSASLCGSSNQTVHILNQKYKNKYYEYLKTVKNQIQNFSGGKGIISVGIRKSQK